MPKDVAGVMHEFKHHELHSGKGGAVVTDPKQAVAIAMSEKRQLEGDGAKSDPVSVLRRRALRKP